MEFAAKTGKSPAVYNIRYIKPIDGDILDRIACEFKTVLTVEDGCVAGGLFGAVSEYMSARGCGVKVVPTGIPDKFISQGTQKELRAECGLDKEHILALIFEEFEKI